MGRSKGRGHKFTAPSGVEEGSKYENKQSFYLKECDLDLET